ncbi:SDE2 homolog, putative [Babesia ovis]|uniref:SDE2 homolog, putative n=1 Tax=Babesia ovis TaxID=5869 RepID=A0A9W5TDK2_BABOV|nr:SDE2 homolog, putative [Babesia ovis]
MAMCIFRLPNGDTRCINADYDMFRSCVDQEDELFLHSCRPEDACRESIPCISGSVFPSLIQNVIGIPCAFFRLNVSEGKKVRLVSRCDDNTISDDAYTPRSSPTFSEVDNVSTQCTEQLSWFYNTQRFKIKDQVLLNLSFRLLGGKGGFGALLKGKGQRKKQSSNIDSCRTLTGERIRHTRLTNLAQRQNANTLDPETTKLPLPKEQPDCSTAPSSHDSKIEHLHKVSKEAKRVKRTVTKGLKNFTPSSEQAETDLERQEKLERTLNVCLDMYNLE